MPCVFCEIVAGRIPSLTVWEDPDHLLMMDIRPIAPAHLLLLPKKHTDDLFDLPEREYATLLETARTLAPVLRQATNAKRIGMVVEGFGVPHVHVHLVPVNGPGELNPSKAQPASEESLENWHQKLKPRFKPLG